MKKVLFIATLFLSLFTSFGQVTIWSEDFESYALDTGVKGSGTVNSGDYPSGVTKWTLDVTDSHFTAATDFFMTQSYNSSKQLCVRDSNGYPDSNGIVYWYSESIDISIYTNVSVEMDIVEDGDLENTDFYRVQYRIDGGTWTTFTTAGYDDDDFGSAHPEQTGLSGSTLEIRIKTRTTAGSEYIYFDNIVVKGTLSGIISVQSGNWSDTNTWDGGVVPTSSDNAIIDAGHTVTMDNSTYAIRDAGTTTTVQPGGILATSVTYTNNGTTTVKGSFQLNAGGWATGNDLEYGSDGTLIFNTAYTANSGSYWPTTNGPVNVTVSGGDLTLGFDRTVTGTFKTSAGVKRSGSETLTLEGVAEIDAGGWFDFEPLYGSSSTLLYNVNGDYGRYKEWNSTTAGAPGYPYNVQLSNNTNLNPGANGGTGIAWEIGGNLTIDAGSGFYMDWGTDDMTQPITVKGDVIINGGLSLSDSSGGDLYVEGNWTNTGTFAPKGRLVKFSGSSAQSIIGATTFDYLTIDNTSGLTLNNPVTINQNLDFTNGQITLGNDLTIESGATITNYNGSNYFVVGGNGKLTRKGVGNTDTDFPVGLNASDYTPITLNNTSGISDLSVNLNGGITNPVHDDTRIVTLEWQVTSSAATTATVKPTWKSNYEAANFTNTGNGELGNYTTKYDIYAVTLNTDNTTATGVSLQSGLNYIVVGDENSILNPQEIDIRGNDVSIANGDTSPSQIDWTDFRHVRVAGNTSVSRTFTIYNTGDKDLHLTGTSDLVTISGANASDFTVTQQPSNSTVTGGGSVDFKIDFNPSDYGVRTAKVSIANDDSDENPYTFDIQGTGADYTDCAGIDYIQDFESTPAEPELQVTYQSGHLLDSSGITDSLYPQGENYYASPSNALYIHGDYGGTLEFASVDTRNYQDVSFTVRLAAFSSTSGNGMDGPDYVTVLVSTDDGANYTEEIKVKGNNNAKWSFDTGTGLAQVKYDGNGTPLVYQPAGGGYRTSDGYSTIRIRNLPKVEKLRIKIWTSENSDKEYWMIDDAKLIGRKATVWDGTAWNSGAPTKIKKAVINGDYDASSDGGSIHTCECEIRPGKSLTVTDGTNLLVETDIINFGSLLITNEGSLVQRKSDALIAGEGSYELDKTSLSVDEETDYVYWSSPLNSNNFTLGEIVNNAWRYYKFDPAVSSGLYPGWVQLSSNDIVERGMGYAISAPNGTNSSTTLNANFVKDHDPFNNGDIAVNIYKKGTNPGDDLNYNLLGNPYPSAIDFNALVNDPDNSDVDGSYYLWTNCAGLLNGQHQSSGYTVYSASGTATAACNNSSNPTAGQYIATGQGFFIEANTDNSTLTFKNKHRVIYHNNNFVNRPNTSNQVAWLNMTDDTGNFNQIAVGFYPGATTGYDRLYDAHTMNDGTDFALYSVSGNHKLVINGLSDTNIDGITVPLTVEVTTASNLTIALDHQNGLDNYDIYLIDNGTQNTVNLKTNDYTFNLPAGIYEGRFELVFNSVTGVEDKTLPDTAVLLSQLHGVFTLRSMLDNEQLQEVRVYDINGRTLFERTGINSQEMQVDLSNLPNGSVVFFKVLTASQKSVVKKAVKLK